MSIHTVNEHPDMQANKLNRCKNTKVIASRIQDPTRAHDY